MKILNDEELAKLPTYTQAQMDEMNVGIVKVDDSGVIQMYNAEEGRIGNVAPASVIGKNFFTEVAPCTNNRLFYGKFKEGVAAGELDTTMPYTFTYKIKPTLVDIRLYHDKGSKSNWVLVKRK